MQSPRTGVARTAPQLGGLHRRRFEMGLLRVLLVVALFAGGGAVIHAASFPESATVSLPAERLVSSVDANALIISDSTWLSMRVYGAFDAVQGFRNEMALAHCRRRVDRSCRNPAGRPKPLIEELTDRGTVYGRNTLVVQTGYNDGDATFERDFRLIVSTARQLNYTSIVWLTLRPPQNGSADAQKFRNCNEILQNLVASGEFPEVVIADWATYSEAQNNWVTGDQIHYTEAGAWAAADYISRKMAALTGAPCPYPMAPGDANPAVCPDPDTLAAKPDLVALYPVSRPYYKPSYDWTGSSSWPKPPWWS